MVPPLFLGMCVCVCVCVVRRCVAEAGKKKDAGQFNATLHRSPHTQRTSIIVNRPTISPIHGRGPPPQMHTYFFPIFLFFLLPWAFPKNPKQTTGRT
jgi:hypothetical protein